MCSSCRTATNGRADRQNDARAGRLRERNLKGGRRLASETSLQVSVIRNKINCATDNYNDDDDN